jgi:hypothetical protein
MPPPRRSAFEVSFPDEIREDEATQAAAAQARARLESASGVHTRKDAKRKKLYSTVDARVSEICYTNDTYLWVQISFPSGVGIETSSLDT